VNYAGAMTESTETGAPAWLNRAWIGLTMAAVLVLALYVYDAQQSGERIWFTIILLALSVTAGAAGVGYLKREESTGILLLRVASMIAIVGIITFQF
jgi:hypothetical protein